MHRPECRLRLAIVAARITALVHILIRVLCSKEWWLPMNICQRWVVRFLEIDMMWSGLGHLWACGRTDSWQIAHFFLCLFRTFAISQLPSSDRASAVGCDKILSYRRDRAAGCVIGLVFAKSKDWNWETIFYGHFRSIFNHCDIIGLKICRSLWKKTQNKGYYGVQGHSRSSRSVQIESPYAISY